MSRSASPAKDQPVPPAPIRVPFGVRALEAMPAPAKGRLFVWDDPARPRGVPNLALQITAAGARSFYHVRKVRGRKVRTLLGKWGEVTIDQARRQAARLNARYAAGENPVADRQKADQALTVGTLFEMYLQRHAKVHKRTWQEDEAQYLRHLKRWKNRRVVDITRAEVATLHARIGRTSPIAANRVLALLSVMFTFAQTLDFEGANPCRGVKKFSEQSRERFLDADELPRFLRAVEQEPNTAMRDYLWLLLLTGQRRSNVASMTWNEIDLGRRVWIIPADKFKNGQTTTVPLVKAALDMLQRRAAKRLPENDPRAEYVFPSRSVHAKVPHLAEPTIAMRRICKAAGVTDLRLHDLRRTTASWATMVGVPFPIVARMVGHSAGAGGVTSIYARFDLTALRDAFDRTAEAMLATLQLNASLPTTSEPAQPALRTTLTHPHQLITTTTDGEVTVSHFEKRGELLQALATLPDEVQTEIRLIPVAQRNDEPLKG